MDIPSIIYLSDEWETANDYALYDSVATNLTFYRSLVTNPLKEDLLFYSQSYLTSKYPYEHFNDDISHHVYENLFREKSGEWADLVAGKNRQEFTRRMKAMKNKLEKVAPDFVKSYEKMYRIVEGL